ncbi:septin-9 isoform X1 [Polypterus senegalus]|uniref:septin-9 isoform X1 n=2 Tax=Polypterus senegalus TaxID=55291 RepID=UPI0019657066|nr:septin-9 isoform X1 [Polypterus senegalus]
MSDLSVNDHLEGILSDFEALKRSFDIEDVDEIPTFSPTSPLSSPFSPPSGGLILTKGNEGRGPPSHIPPTYQSRITINSSPSPSPVMKNKMVSSLSFNRGSLAKTNGNTGTSITRVSSFQTKFNPNGFSSLSGPGSDNDSLHSSTSSLEYQASSKMSSYTSPPQSPVGMNDLKGQRLCSPALKKFSSHGNMFHSDVEPTLVLVSDPSGMNHVSMPSLDLHISENRATENMRLSNLGQQTARASWITNSQKQNSRPVGRENSFTSTVQPPKPKEPVRLKKFPLDLDNLVGKSEAPPVESISKAQPRPQPRVNSIPDTLGSSINVEAVAPAGHFPVPNISDSPIPLSPPQTPQFKLVTQPQVVQLAPVAQPAVTQARITRSATVTGQSTWEPSQEKETVGSILQRIASFSRADSIGGFKPKENSYHGNKREQEAEPIQQKEEPRINSVEDKPLALEAADLMTHQTQRPDPYPEMETKPESNNSAETPMSRSQEPFGYVGIESVLDQMRRKAMKTGFEFNIMVVGQSGLGKSTLVNTLFKSRVSRKSCQSNYEEKISKTVNLMSVSHIIEEKGVKMKLTVIDTPGFGDQINNENCWDPIIKYINEQYEKYLKEELNINRKKKIPDSRIHCCIYFVPPTGHWLRPLDVEFMKRLGKIVSIVPVIAKADTLTLEERQEFKYRIRQDLQAHGIRVYPHKEFDEDAEDRILNDKIREKIPFAVVGTDREHQVNGNKVLGRKTKWGIIEVENVAHCEFANLRDLLIRSHLQDLKDVTHNIHYECYRVRRLNESNMNLQSGLSSVNGVMDKNDSQSNL